MGSTAHSFIGDTKRQWKTCHRSSPSCRTGRSRRPATILKSYAYIGRVSARLSG